MPDYDAIIIGGGPAGISSLIWCASTGLRAVLLERSAEIGGQLLLMHHPLPDYPGLLPRDGRELRDHFENHLRSLQLEWRTSCEIESVDVAEKKIYGHGQALSAHALILAPGVRKRWLDIPGEAALIGKGISDNATRDRMYFAGRKVCVTGGGDSAFEDAFILADVCPHVTLLHRSQNFRARRSWIERVLQHPRIEVITDVDVISVEAGENQHQIAGVRIRHRRANEQRVIAAEGLVVQIGVTPNTEFLRGQVALDSGGWIRTDAYQQTSAEMVYAAGDVCHPVCLSVAVACGQGAIAAKHLAERLRTDND
jgi:thioredoxin reductase (NADPH)